MSELEDRLNSLLENPEELGRVAQMAQKLMGQFSPDGERESTPEESPLPGAMQRIIQGLTGNSGKGKHLLEAVAPYLDEGRRRRLARSLRVASAARLALTVLSESGGNDGL